MKLSVCVDAVYRGKDFAESVNDVREAGYDSIEFWTWWDKDLDKVERAVEEAGVRVASFCTKFVSLVDPLKRSEYVAALEETIAVARRLKCGSLITQVGQALADVPDGEQRQSIVDGLKACVPLLERENVTLLVEPLNTKVNHKGYYLSSSAEAFEIVRQVGSTQVKVLYDIYHQQITEGNLIATIAENIGLIGHFHAAGNPGRHELDVGELNYEYILKAIEEFCFDGYIGLEYFPLDVPSAGLRRLRS